MFQGSYKHVVITDERFPFFFAVASLSAQLVAVLFWRRTTCSFYSIQVFTSDFDSWNQFFSGLTVFCNYSLHF